VNVGIGVGVGVGLFVGVGDGLGEGVVTGKSVDEVGLGDGVVFGIERETPLLHTSFFPDLTQVNVLPA
jgi:hypothetical protein